jgi:8-oxo-dGTP diphosphatase
MEPIVGSPPRPEEYACHHFRSSRKVTVMPLPYKIATLLYCFNERDEVLLMERTQEPNCGLWSPCGGKLMTDIGESPYACACREAAEELQLQIAPKNLHLTGIVSEHGYLGQSHWLMFLFEVKPRLTSCPPPHREGRFDFFSREQLNDVALPQTDREKIWPWFWQHRGGFFAAHCHCHANGTNDWQLYESRVDGRESRAGSSGPQALDPRPSALD